MSDYSLNYEILSGNEQGRSEIVQSFILDNSSPEGNRFRVEGGRPARKER